MSAASEAAASTQLTMDTCKRAVTKAYVDAAVARFIYGGLGSPSRGLWGPWGCKIH
jgi:hypothetical protein